MTQLYQFMRSGVQTLMSLHRAQIANDSHLFFVPLNTTKGCKGRMPNTYFMPQRIILNILTAIKNTLRNHHSLHKHGQ